MYFKTIEFPYIRVKINFLDISKLKGIPITGSAYTCEMEGGEICVFIQDIEKSVKDINMMPYIAHEIVHVLQIICAKLQTNIQDEKEHTAYLMHYILQELINHK